MLAYEIASGALERWEKVSAQHSDQKLLKMEMAAAKAAITFGPIIDITFAEQVYRNLEKQHGGAKHFPGVNTRWSSLCLPYEWFWMESKGPLYRSDDECVPQELVGHCKTGYATTGMCIDTEFCKKASGVLEMNEYEKELIDSQGKFFRLSSCVFMKDTRGLVYPICQFHVSFGGDGVFDISKVGAVSSVPFSASRLVGRKHSDATLYECLWPFLEALAVLGSKNTEICGHIPKPRVVRQSNKNAGESKWGWKHHTIVVKDRKGAVIADLTDLAKESSDKSLHMVRGHFSTYTKERPLFGKYTGTFYKPPHTRGNVDIGVVTKDYRVECTTHAS